MRYRKLGKTDMNVSEIGLGTWAYGNDYYGRVDDNDSIKAIQTSIESGVNLIDTAPAYGAGHAEEVVGKAIAGKREKIIITTKCGTIRKPGKFLRDSSPKAIREELDMSLRRLNTDYIDVYLLHWPDPNTPLEDTVNEICRLKKTGKFRYFGVSNFSMEQIEFISKIMPVEVYQPQYSILYRDLEAQIRTCSAAGIGIMSYGSLAGGMLTGKFSEKPVFSPDDTRSNFYKYFLDPLWDKSKDLVDQLKEIAASRDHILSEMSINFVSQSDIVDCALVGAKNMKQALSNAAAANWVLSLEERNMINAAYRNVFDLHGI